MIEFVSKNYCAIIMIVNAFLSAFSQILLKKSAMKEHKSGIYEYLNVYVITAYGIFVIVLLSNAFAYTGVDYKYGSILGSFSYFFVMVLSRIILKEKITKNILMGNLLIILGVIIYSLGR